MKAVSAAAIMSAAFRGSMSVELSKIATIRVASAAAVMSAALQVLQMAQKTAITKEQSAEAIV